MVTVHVAITAWIDDTQPGIVACALIDAWGHEHMIVKKAPIVTTAVLDQNSIYPQAGVIACEIVPEWIDQRGQRLVTISTERPWAIMSTTGVTHFDVQPESVVNET